ncbi:hypothetical protein B0H16DRAFT_1698962 [Mycena metata]|uniref:Uncharacterized protein n=1 Tax=Mycena metata TaxID=1033252 RepID=A0AAD7MMZ9_9AGAR|nr:hypothetical protein B0H16DRAFT_1698962 [Mycena metata]
MQGSKAKVDAVHVGNRTSDPEYAEHILAEKRGNEEAVYRLSPDNGNALCHVQSLGGPRTMHQPPHASSHSAWCLYQAPGDERPKLDEKQFYRGNLIRVVWCTTTCSNICGMKELRHSSAQKDDRGVPAAQRRLNHPDLSLVDNQVSGDLGSVNMPLSLLSVDRLPVPDKYSAFALGQIGHYNADLSYAELSKLTQPGRFIPFNTSPSHLR